MMAGNLLDVFHYKIRAPNINFRRKKDKSQGGLREFPGGKLEPGELVEECLKRELREEMNIEIQPYESFGVNEHDYGAVHIRLIAHKAAFVSGEIVLVDHDCVEWVRPEELKDYEFAPADVKFVEMLSR